MADYTFSNGVTIVNTTPHPITFQDGDTLISIDSTPEDIINATVSEEAVLDKGCGVTFVKSKFNGSEEGKAKIERLYNEYGEDAIIIGSILAAQAYPGQVFGMTPVPGFERVAPAEKRMRIGKFVTY